MFCTYCHKPRFGRVYALTGLQPLLFWQVCGRDCNKLPSKGVAVGTKEELWKALSRLMTRSDGSIPEDSADVLPSVP